MVVLRVVPHAARMNEWMSEVKLSKGRTDGEEAGHLGAEGFRAGDLLVEIVDGGGGATDESGPGVDGCERAIAGRDGHRRTAHIQSCIYFRISFATKRLESYR